MKWSSARSHCKREEYAVRNLMALDNRLMRTAQKENFRIAGLDKIILLGQRLHKVWGWRETRSSHILINRGDEHDSTLSAWVSLTILPLHSALFARVIPRETTRLPVKLTYLCCFVSNFKRLSSFSLSLSQQKREGVISDCKQPNKRASKQSNVTRLLCRTSSLLVLDFLFPSLLFSLLTSRFAYPLVACTASPPASFT